MSEEQSTEKPVRNVDSLHTYGDFADAWNAYVGRRHRGDVSGFLMWLVAKADGGKEKKVDMPDDATQELGTPTCSPTRTSMLCDTLAQVRKDIADIATVVPEVESHRLRQVIDRINDALRVVKEKDDV